MMRSNRGIMKIFGKVKQLPKAVAVVIALVLIGVIVRGALSFRDDEGAFRKEAGAIAPGDLALVTVERKEVAEELELLGQILFREKVAIASKVEGRLARIRVDAGDRVAAGTLIAEIERLPLELQMRQQEAELDIARKAYDLSKAKYENALKAIEVKFRMIQKARADLHDKQVSFENMDRVLKNKTRLRDAGGVSESELKTVKAQHTTVHTALLNAGADLEIQLVGYRDEDITTAGYPLPSADKEKIELFKKLNTRIEYAELQSAQSRIRQAENAIRSTEMMLRETSIRSPLTGIVASKNMEAGEMVKGDSVIAVVMNIARVYVAVNVNEKDLKKLHQGQRVDFTVDALGDRTFEARIARITPLLDTKTRTVEVKAEMANPGMALVPGMFARAKIRVGSPEKRLLVPRSALITAVGDQGELYLVKKGIAFRQKVILGPQFGDSVEVTKGIEERDTIVAKGVNSVYPGMVLPKRKGTERL
ncbi:MAG: efflux RND transporter periplasmic adaptor subunit [Spirochaetes bacterium]|nr:efflux RND transporter periplasmic adaptor subunit [Spirochaetota bacterium]